MPQVTRFPVEAAHRLPLECLVVAPGKTAKARRYWIDEGPALSYGASGSTLLRSLQPRPDSPAPERLAVALGDPIFTRVGGGAVGATGGLDRGPLLTRLGALDVE